MEQLIDGLIQLVQQLWGQLVNIPLQNPLSYLYAILNIILQLFAWSSS